MSPMGDLVSQRQVNCLLGRNLPNQPKPCHETRRAGLYHAIFLRVKARFARIGVCEDSSFVSPLPAAALV